MPSIEVVANSTKTEKPGWAYVPDTGFDPTKAPFQQSGARKRNARVFDSSDAGLSARQSAALAKRLAELDRDNSRDLAVPVPSKQRPKPKTATAKKIIESQRSFSHFLADEEARNSGETDTIQTKSRTYRPRTGPGGATAMNISFSDEELSAELPADAANASTNQAAYGDQAFMPGEALLLYAFSPSAPSEALMFSLGIVNALSWTDARARPTQLGRPDRSFCELCGYWGRVRCMHCGARLCSLVCKRTHHEDRCQKYGA